MVALACLWLASGCGNDGSYEVKWTFFASVSPSDGTSVVKPFTPGDCGKTGVSGIMITGTKADGSQDRPVVPCAPGTYTRSLGAGTWTLELTALDAGGHIKEPAASGLLRGPPDGAPLMVVVTDGQVTSVQAPVLLPPLPACRDGVDNDRDGRVDLDDPDCAGDPNGPHECVPTASGPCPDTSP